MDVITTRTICALSSKDSFRPNQVWTMATTLFVTSLQFLSAWRSGLNKIPSNLNRPIRPATNNAIDGRGLLLHMPSCKGQLTFIRHDDEDIIRVLYSVIHDRPTVHPVSPSSGSRASKHSSGEIGQHWIKLWILNGFEKKAIHANDRLDVTVPHSDQASGNPV